MHAHIYTIAAHLGGASKVICLARGNASNVCNRCPLNPLMTLSMHLYTAHIGFNTPFGKANLSEDFQHKTGNFRPRTESDAALGRPSKTIPVQTRTRANSNSKLVRTWYGTT